MLHQNIAEVYRALDVVAAQRETISGGVPESTARIYELVDEIDTTLDAMRRRLPRPDGPIVAGDVSAIRGRTQEARDLLDHIDALVGMIRPVPPGTARAISTHLAKLKTTVDKTEALLRSVTGADADGDSPAATQAAWVKEQGLFKEAGPSFTQHVQLLTGLALQGAGYDNGIAAIADTLLRDRVGVSFAMTIPGDRWRDELTAAKFLHLGFPEWTPWALPLAAFDVSRIGIEDASLHDTIDRASTATAGADVETCFADIVATYQMGPAYAWATTIIQLDPAAEAGERAAANLRVAVMAETLRNHDPEDRETVRTFHTIADDLTTAWATARSEVEGPAAPDAALMPSAEVIGSWLTALGNLRYRRLSDGDWATVRQVADRLKARDGEIEVTDVRVVLNAAWVVRLEEGYDTSGDEAPLVELGERTVALLRKIAGMPPAPTPSNRPRPPSGSEQRA
jgi:cytochrome c556